MPKLEFTVNTSNIKTEKMDDKTIEITMSKIKLEAHEDIKLLENLVGKTVTITTTDLKEIAPYTHPPEIETKAKVSGHFINSYFNTEDTIKNYQGQLEINFSTTQDIATLKKDMAVIVSKGFRGINLNYQENRTMKGVFSLLEKQNASENRPFIVLNNISQLYEEILERKVTKKLKDGYTFKDFSGNEIKLIDGALEKLKEVKQQIIIKGQNGYDKKKKQSLYYFYMKDSPLIQIEYLKQNIPESEIREFTEQQLKETGQIKISILSILLKDYHKYFKLLPKDISKEIREVCPEVKKVSEPIVNFFDFLHRQENTEVRRARTTLIKELKLDEQYQKNKKRTLEALLNCYDIAKRTGYLKDYTLDHKGKFELVDILYLNPDKYYHHKTKQLKEATKEALSYDKAG